MKIPDALSEQKLIVEFVEDNDSIAPIRSRLQPEIIRDDFSLNFHDMLERQWTLEQDDAFLPSKSLVVTTKHIKTMQDKEVNKIGSMIFGWDKSSSSDLQNHRSDNLSMLKNIQTVFQNPDPIEDIDLFLESNTFQNSIRCFVLVFLVGLILTDYSFRLDQTHSKSQPISILNKVSLNLQLFANCAFSLELILKMFSRQKFFSDPWRIINLIGCISCWMTLYMDFMYYDSYPLFSLLFCLKILLVVRIIQLFQFIRTPFEDFITTIPELGKIFFPLLIFIAFYSVLGLILFSGANQYKCRATQKPVGDSWPEVSTNLCGSVAFQCNKGYCGNPMDYGLSYNTTQKTQYGNQYGLLSYDNIASSFFTTYHYVFLSNWTSIKYKFSRFITPYVTNFYFFTSALFLFFIMANLNMITICKAYIEKEKSRDKMSRNQTEQSEQQQKKDQKKKQKLTENISPVRTKAYLIIQYIQITVIVLSSIVILIDYEGIDQQLQNVFVAIDFSFIILSIIIVVLKIGIIKKLVFKNYFNILDWVVLFLSLIDIIYSSSVGLNPVNPQTQLSIILRSIKFVRIVRIIYFSQSWFQFEKTILKMFGQTIKTMKFLFILVCCLVLITAFIGQNLFAFRIRFNPVTHQVDIQHGVPYVSNYDSIYKALVSVTLMLENQRWTETMYNYYKAVGWQAVIFFTIIVFIIHLMLMRLFIAIFLCYFRRNLQKNSSYAESQTHLSQRQIQLTSSRTTDNIKEGMDEYLDQKRGQCLRISQGVTQEVQSTNKNTNNKQLNKLFWFFSRQNYIFQMFRAIYSSNVLKNIIILLLGIHCLTIIIRSSDDSPQKTYIIDSVEKAPLIGYCIEVLIGIIGNGFYFQQKSYLKQSKINYLNIIVVFLIVIAEINVLGELQVHIIRRFAILKIFTPLARANKQTLIILKAISAIAQNFIRVFAIYIFLLLIPCVILLKLENDQLYDCKNYYTTTLLKPNNYQDCMLRGGDWVKDSQSFTNIFSSLVLMYQIVTSESWTYYIERLDNSRPWDVYFVLNFFIYNTCLLNIFVGLTVETYLALKDQAYKLNLLRPNQRMWMLIRNSINQLVPVPAMKEPITKSFFRKLSFKIISQNIYEKFIDIMAYANVITYTLRYYRADSQYLSDLYSLNVVFTVILCCDTVLKLQLGWDYFFLDSSRIQLAGLIFFVGYGIVSLALTLDHDSFRTLQFLGAMFLILRCKKLIFRYTWCKTLVNSVLDVLPKCIKIGQILALILFLYVAIGMQLFKHTKPTPKIDGYTTGFNNALTSLMTLLKIVSNQSWFQQVGAYVRGSTPADICFPINSFADAQNHHHMGCGSSYAYFFFISFHAIMALLILNLLIATMTAAYDQNYEKQYKSVNVFQLQDCLKLWQKYDPEGSAVIPYKKFWRLSSEIAILFGISKKKLIKSKQKFLEELDIDICQSTSSDHTSVLCYKFHDVIMKFSKIKLQVSKSECSQQSSEVTDFEIHSMIENEIKDYLTNTPPLYQNYRPYKNFKSGEMKYFFGLLRKLRAWRLVAKKRDSSVISKLSQIIKVALQKRRKQEFQMGQIRTHFLGSY